MTYLVSAVSLASFVMLVLSTLTICYLPDAVADLLDRQERSLRVRRGGRNLPGARVWRTKTSRTFTSRDLDLVLRIYSLEVCAALLVLVQSSARSSWVSEEQSPWPVVLVARSEAGRVLARSGGGARP